MLQQGQGITTVARAVGVSRQTVYDWIRKARLEAIYEQQEDALIDALLQALQQQDWVFEDLQTTLEQRLGRPLELLHLDVKVLLLCGYNPHLHRVTTPLRYQNNGTNWRRFPSEPH